MLQERLSRADFDDEGGRWTKEAVVEALERHARTLREVQEKEARFPSYQSVAIFVREFPPADVLAEFKQRVKDFGINHQSLFRSTGEKPIEIIAIRLIDRADVATTAEAEA